MTASSPSFRSDEPADIPALRATLDRLELERTACSVLPRDANLVSTDAATRANGVAFLKKCVDRTADLGAKLICGPMYAGLGVLTGTRRTEKEWNWAVKGLRTVATRAQKRGVCICLEPLNRFETYFLNTLEDAARLVRDMGIAQMSKSTLILSIPTSRNSTLPHPCAPWPKIWATFTFPKMIVASQEPATSIGREFLKS